MPKPNALTKVHIFEAVVETNEYTPKKAFEKVQIMIELIKRSLKNGENILISGFEKFSVKKRQSVKAGTRRQART